MQEPNREEEAAAPDAEDDSEDEPPLEPGDGELAEAWWAV
jgi:hypothetical protein